MVRLKVLQGNRPAGKNKRFNSKMVRLKVGNVTISAYKDYSFNSKMVRLKVLLIWRIRTDKAPFQFQNGTIKRK